MRGLVRSGGRVGPRVKSASSSKIYNSQKARWPIGKSTRVPSNSIQPTDRPTWETTKLGHVICAKSAERKHKPQDVSCCLPLQQSETKYHYSLFVSRGDYCAFVPKTTFHSSSYRALFHELSSKLTNWICLHYMPENPGKENSFSSCFWSRAVCERCAKSSNFQIKWKIPKLKASRRSAFHSSQISNKLHHSSEESFTMNLLHLSIFSPHITLQITIKMIDLFMFQCLLRSEVRLGEILLPPSSTPSARSFHHHL